MVREHGLEKQVLDFDGGVLPANASLSVWSHYSALPDGPPFDKGDYALFQGHWTPTFADSWLHRNCCGSRP